MMYDLTFNGAAPPTKAHLIGLNVQSPNVDSVTFVLPYMRGDQFVRSQIGGRTVQLSFALFGETIEENAQLTTQLRSWAFSEAPQELRLPTYGDRHLMAVCTGFAPDVSELGASVDVTFTAHNPEFIANDETSVTGATYTIGGVLDAPIKIECTAPTLYENDTLTILTADVMVQLRGPLTGGTFAIDSESGSVTIDGVNVVSAVTLESDLRFTVSVGNHTITATSTAGTVSGLTVKHRARWL